MIGEFDVTWARRGYRPQLGCIKFRRGIWPIGLLIIVKAFKTFSICKGFSILKGFDFPVFLYTFFTMAGSAVFFLALHQPWKGRKQLKSNQVVLVT